MPTFILGRISLRPAASAFCHVPRVFLRVEVFQSALLTSRTFSTFSTQARLFWPFFLGPRVCQLRALVSLWDESRRQVFACLCSNTVIWLFIKASLVSFSLKELRFYGVAPMLHRFLVYHNSTVSCPPWWLSTGHLSYRLHRYLLYKLP